MRIFLFFLFWITAFTQMAAQNQYAYFKTRTQNFAKLHLKANNVADIGKLNQATALKDSVETAGYKDLSTDVWVLIAKLSQQLGLMGNAEIAYKKAIVLGKSYKDSLWVASLWDRLGDFYLLEDRNYLALDCQFKAFELFKAYGKKETNLAERYNSIAKVYLKLGDIENAQKKVKIAYEIKTKSKDTAALGVIAITQANIYKKQGKFEQAEKLYLMYIPKRLKQKNYEGLKISYLGLAEVYEQWGKMAEAESYYQKALEVVYKINRKRDMGLILLTLGKLYQKQGNELLAKETFQKAIDSCAEVDSKTYQMRAYQNLYQMSKNEGHTSKALTYLELFVALNDSSIKESLSLKLEDMKASFALKERDNEIKILDEENREAKQLQQILLAGITILLTLAVFLIILYKSRNQTLKILNGEQQQTQKLLLEKEALLKELQQSQQHLIHSEKMASLGGLTAGIAHELNNPVSAMSASVQALNMNQQELLPLYEYLQNVDNQEDKHLQQLLAKTDLAFLTEETQYLLKTLTNAAERTALIVGGLKTFSRDTHNQFVPAQITEGIEISLTLLQHKITKDIHIEKKYTTQRLIPCELNKLSQVFLNILDNAIQALNGAGTIYIETEERENQYLIIIRDTGEGMESEIQAKIFEPFFTTKKVGSGTGLGLSISYAIIEQHKGKIEVESVVGQGTTFTLILPME